MSRWCRYRNLTRHIGNFYCQKRNILTKEFALTEEWSERRENLKKFSLGNSYEWITAVQKKYIGGSVASAVDVDCAICGADQDDQINDVVELAYKLRHSVNTGNTLPSTEYSLIRLLINHNKMEMLFKVVNDPINYGVFFNKHSACLAMDYLLNKGKIDGSAKLASIIMLQEMFSSELLNLLSLHSSLRWVELEKEERIFDKVFHNEISATSEEENFNDEDYRIFKFPYLKNESNDRHFDLQNPNELVGKTLLWLSYNVDMEENFLRSIRLIGCVFFNDLVEASELIKQGNILDVAVAICKSRIEEILNNLKCNENEINSDIKLNEELLVSLNSCNKVVSSESLSNVVKSKLLKNQQDLELDVIEEQRKLFDLWSKKRQELIQSQVERLNLRIHLENLKKEMEEIKLRKQILYFFENRLTWEDSAKLKDELLESVRDHSLTKEEAEKEYAKKLFETARNRKREAN